MRRALTFAGALALALTAACDEPPPDEGCEPEECLGVCTDGVCVPADVADGADRDVPDAPNDAPEDAPTDPDVPALDAPELAELEDEPEAGDVAEELADTDARPSDRFVIQILEPEHGLTVELGTAITFRASIAVAGFDEEDLVVDWRVRGASEPLATGSPNAGGFHTFTTDTLGGGTHEVVLTVTDPGGDSAEATVTVSVCTWASPETFDAELDGSSWRTRGDAYWDPGGWLEMTGNLTSRAGAIYNPVDAVNPGDVNISFRVATGGGVNGGADGFAMSIWAARNGDHLAEILELTSNGGCLGYGLSGDCGPHTVNGFHIEIDTWENRGDPNRDPTSANHIGILLDGDATNHVLWAEIPSIEDLAWHTVTVEVDGSAVTVGVDGTEVIPRTHVPGLEFKGGYIAFSGSTGWASNFHRFDDLSIQQECIVR